MPSEKNKGLCKLRREEDDWRGQAWRGGLVISDGFMELSSDGILSRFLKGRDEFGRGEWTFQVEKIYVPIDLEMGKHKSCLGDNPQTSLTNYLAKSKARNERGNHVAEGHEVQGKNFELYKPSILTLPGVHL